MALTSDELQSIVSSVLAAIQTNSRTIEQLTAVSTLGDTDFFEVSGGKKVSYSVLRGLVKSLSTPELDSLRTLVNNCELQSASIATTESSATLTISSKGKTVTASIPVVTSSTAGIMTPADKDAILDHEDRLTFAEERLVAIKAAIDNVLGENASDAIDNFNEILAFLEGCKDDATLQGLLAAINARIGTNASSISDLRMIIITQSQTVQDHSSRLTAAENRLNDNNAELESLDSVLSTLRDRVDTAERELVNVNEAYSHPDAFDEPAAAFSMLGHGRRRIGAGGIAVFLAEGVWQRWLYKGAPAEDEGEAETAAADEDTDVAAQDAADSPQRVAPIFPDKDVSNPENWVRLPDLVEIEDLEAQLEQLSAAPTVELTADEMAAMLPHDDSAVATLALDAPAATSTKAPAAPASSPALERFRARFREMLAHTRRGAVALSAIQSTESTEPSNPDNENE